jgi:hypothetical protein
MLDYRKIKNDRQWKSNTGMSEKQFLLMSELFGETYEFYEGVSLDEGAKRLNVDLLLPTYSDCLFFVLFQLKNGLCYDNLGFLIESDGINAQRNFERNLLLLERTLERKSCLPKRNFETISEFHAYIKDEKEIILDASEQATQRPKGYEKQKEHYSGKKSVIRIKN